MILVTGASGTVGREVARALSARGAPARLARRDPGRAPGGEAVRFDFADPATFPDALSGVRAVFLLRPPAMARAEAFRPFLVSARTAGVGHVAVLSVRGAERNRLLPHHALERLVEASGISFTHLRPNFFMDTVWSGLRHRPDRVVHFIGTRKVSWIAAQDIAAVGAEALRDPDAHRGIIYPLAVEALSFEGIAAILSDVMGHPVEYRPRGAAELLPILLKQGMEPTYAKSLAGGVAAIEAGQMPLADAVYPTVEAVTGRKPIGWREFAEQRKGDLVVR